MSKLLLSLMTTCLVFVSVAGNGVYAASDDEVVVKIEDPEIYTIDSSLLGLQTFNLSTDARISSAVKHTNITPPISKSREHKCKYEGCNKAYTKKENLTRHVKNAHQNVRFSCKHEGCTKVYTDKSSFNQHVKSAHKKITYPCPHCHHPFTQQTVLTQHLKEPTKKCKVRA